MGVYCWLVGLCDTLPVSVSSLGWKWGLGWLGYLAEWHREALAIEVLAFCVMVGCGGCGDARVIGKLDSVLEYAEMLEWNSVHGPANFVGWELHFKSPDVLENEY